MSDRPSRRLFAGLLIGYGLWLAALFLMNAVT